MGCEVWRKKTAVSLNNLALFSRTLNGCCSLQRWYPLVFAVLQIWTSCRACKNCVALLALSNGHACTNSVMRCWAHMRKRPWGLGTRVTWQSAYGSKTCFDRRRWLRLHSSMCPMQWFASDALQRCVIFFCIFRYEFPIFINIVCIQ